ncbi:unnamed protein product [Notodromas monacha]|uniref:Uncharacterized protein n=1 Tax=Notodromas monacha TaxID=399045 RepID=A0A7R9BCV0_9CRUS|nr:unnamed protein product [Notodromas monacha]CAG0912433.1 unnamed protein product [Notodromas monacha]
MPMTTRQATATVVNKKKKEKQQRVKGKRVLGRKSSDDDDDDSSLWGSCECGVQQSYSRLPPPTIDDDDTDNNNKKSADSSHRYVSLPHQLTSLRAVFCAYANLKHRLLMRGGCGGASDRSAIRWTNVVEALMSVTFVLFLAVAGYWLAAGCETLPSFTLGEFHALVQRALLEEEEKAASGTRTTVGDDYGVTSSRNAVDRSSSTATVYAVSTTMEKALRVDGGDDDDTNGSKRHEWFFLLWRSVTGVLREALPYPLTSYPNMVGHRGPQESEQVIATLAAILTTTRCNPLVHPFVCSVLEPFCTVVRGGPSAPAPAGGPSTQQHHVVKPPCRQFCQTNPMAVINKFLKEAGVPENFEMVDFPDLDVDRICETISPKPPNIHATRESEEPKEIYFVKESFPNASGPIAMIHAFQLPREAILAKFEDDCNQDQTPEARVTALKDYKELMEKQAKSESQLPTMELTPYYYVAIVQHQGTMHELGWKQNWTQSTWTNLFCQNFRPRCCQGMQEIHPRKPWRT